MSEVKTKVVWAKPGIFVLDGKYKIERFDDLNWVIRIKSEEPVKDRVRVVKSRGTEYIYKSDGYVPDGAAERYFGSVAHAVEHIINTMESDAILGEQQKITMEDYLNRITENTEKILGELKGYEPVFD